MKIKKIKKNSKSISKSHIQLKVVSCGKKIANFWKLKKNFVAMSLYVTENDFGVFKLFKILI